jgi:type I restriction enzyme S subunit
MEVKTGYKQTEVGVIPEEWEVKKLGAVVEKFVNGGTPSTKNENYWTGNIPWITGADILNQKVAEVRRHITKEAVKCSSTNVIGKGNLLLVSRTGVGKLAIAPFDIAISQDFTGVYVREDTLIPEYLYRYFDFNQAVLQGQNQGTSIKGITRDTLSAIRIPLPPTKAEQRAIAKALGNADALLATLEKLIAKKRDLKQAAMQQLLTGQIRLPGFSEEWKPKKVGELLNYERPDKYIVKSTDYQENAMTPVLTANKSFVLGYTSEDFGIYSNLPVIIFDDFTTDSKYVDFPFKVKSSAIKILKSRSASTSLKFVYERIRLIQFPLGEHKRYYISEFQHIDFPTPEPDEQTAIADVLSDMDAETAALEQRQAKTRALKQGMMQELLTGKIRLI